MQEKNRVTKLVRVVTYEVKSSADLVRGEELAFCKGLAFSIKMRYRETLF